ncbi:hypothetical protein QCA50_013047 [Cerrena zonata]|uniref:Uncharacterized protein n=1 Tax=Cerrena zonata TaxID=2478898 RepID=A0AAW0G208_9APHY
MVPTLTIPQRLQLLSCLCYDGSLFPAPPPLFTGVPTDPLDPLIPKLLDALLFFLHTDVKNRTISALSLTVSSKEAIVTLATNANGQSSTSSSQAILETI